MKQKEQHRKVTKTKSQLFEKINKTDKHLAKWNKKKKKENIQIRIRNEGRDITSAIQKKYGM